MVESSQNFVDLHQKESFQGPIPWLSQPEQGSTAPAPADSSSNASGGNFDDVLFRNLVEMVPLVESLMHRRSKSSYCRRASLNYTRAPSSPGESFLKKNADQKGRKAQNNASKKYKEFENSELSDNMSKDSKSTGVEAFSTSSSCSSALELDREELTKLKGLVEELQKKLLEKDEALKTAENSLNELNLVHIKLDELNKQVIEKDSVLKVTHLQLSNLKKMLADKQAAVEKLEWEAMTSNKQVEKLECDLETTKDEITQLVLVFEELAKSDADMQAQESTYLLPINQFKQLEPADEMEVQKMEEAQKAYLSAVATAKENPNDLSLHGAAEARLRLLSLLRLD